MRITDGQRQLLDSLICERLSSNEAHLRMVDNFCNGRNGSLEHTLKNEAYAEDEDGNIAFYLIKDADKHILFYFSIKCGMLYDRFGEGEKLRKINELFRFLVELEQDPSSTEEDRKTIDSILENIRTRKGLVKKDLSKISHIKKSQVIEDFEKESEDNLKRVGKTFAGIEIVHFCANDDCRPLWEKFNIQQKLGAVVFWHFLIPKICELRKIAGCEYLFLFAADLTPDELLVNYYRANLGFKDSNEYGTAIPLYDYACKFMYQELKDIEERREAFYADFNPDEEAIE
ncbi:hypothetical protein [Bacteroides clarus]|uniref:hypothetical protein n=1 Tax=Bacteroides clarus TaxID=626929 RepID=UPI0024B0794D|nr:hypothetical protein [Bacteroides clarus]